MNPADLPKSSGDTNPLVDGDGRLHLYNAKDHGIRLHITTPSRLFYSLFSKTVELKNNDVTYVVNVNSAITYFAANPFPDNPTSFTKQLYQAVMEHQVENVLNKFETQLQLLQRNSDAISKADYPQTVSMTKELHSALENYKNRLLAPTKEQPIAQQIQEAKKELACATENLARLNQQLKIPEAVETTAKKLNKAQALQISPAIRQRVEAFVTKAHFESPAKKLQPIQTQFQWHALKLAPAHVLFTRKMHDVKSGLLALSGTIKDYVHDGIPALCSFFELRYDSMSRMQDELVKLEKFPHTHKIAFARLSDAIDKWKNAQLPPTEALTNQLKKELALIDELLRVNVQQVGLERTLESFHQDLQALAQLPLDLQKIDTAKLPKALQEKLALCKTELQKIATHVKLDDVQRDSIKEVIGAVQEFRPAIWEVTNCFKALTGELQHVPPEQQKLSQMAEQLLKATKKYPAVF